MLGVIALGELHLVRRSLEFRARETPLSVSANNNTPVTSTSHESNFMYNKSLTCRGVMGVDGL